MKLQLIWVRMLRAILGIARKLKRKLPYLANKGVKVKIITKRIETDVPFLKVMSFIWEDRR
jgi:hypothetical protein